MERQSLLNENGSFRNLECDLVDREGNSITVLQSAEVFKADGVRYGLISSIDVTESRKKEKELMKEHEQFRNLLNSLRDGVVVIIEGETVFVNDSLINMIGYTNSELCMKSFTEFVFPWQRNRVYSIYQRYICGDHRSSMLELELVKKNGSKIPVEVSVSLISFNGEDAMLATIRDITERKYHEM